MDTDPILTKAFDYEVKATERFMAHRRITDVKREYSQDIDPYLCWDSHLYRDDEERGIWIEVKERADKYINYPTLMVDEDKITRLMKLPGIHFYINVICGKLLIWDLDKLKWEDCKLEKGFLRTTSSWDSTLKDSNVWLLPKKYATIIDLNQ